MMRRLRLLALVVFPLILRHLLFPASLLLQVWRASHVALYAWLPMLYLAATYVALIHVSGAWSWFGRIPRLSLPLLLAFATAARWTRAGRVASQPGPDPIDLVLPIGLGTVLLVLFVLAV